ncbi:MAG: hypothetical protein ACRDMZ_08270, partial [Solirubrobacteraceae bacterium]
RRDVTGPTALGILAGEYRYGEAGPGGATRGPRQLTSVAPAAGAATTFDYDAAGRVVRQGGRTLTYNDFDQLLTVSGIPGGAVHYGYGYDGLRVSTVAPSGSETIRFTPSITEKPDGTREIDVRLGERLIARVTRVRGSEDGTEIGGLVSGDHRGIAIAAIGNALLLLAAAAAFLLGSRRRNRPHLAVASAGRR